MSSAQDLVIDWEHKVVLVSGDIDVDVLDTPLVAIVTSDSGWSYVGDVSDSHWEFLVYGQPTTWADLTDEQRMVVRTASAWSGQVRDYWVELEYEDEGWYGIEALEQL